MELKESQCVLETLKAINNVCVHVQSEDKVYMLAALFNVLKAYSKPLFLVAQEQQQKA